jgi:thiazole synthase
MPPIDECLRIAGREFTSRLLVGTGKYASFEQTARCVALSGAAMVTVAVRRVNITDRGRDNLLDYLDLKQVAILPNTAGCYTADDAIRTARLAREALDNPWIKLEVIGDQATLFPDTQGLLEATRVLAAEGCAWSTPALPRSCRWPRPSAPAWASRMPPTCASCASASPRCR